MDPNINIAMIVAALASGAMASVTEQAIKAGYERLKALLRQKYDDVALEPIEQQPQSASVREALGLQLSAANASGDEELLRIAKEILDQVEKHALQEAEAAGIEIRKIKAEYAKFGEVRAKGPVRFEELELKGGLETGNIEAGVENYPKR